MPWGNDSGHSFRESELDTVPHDATHGLHVHAVFRLKHSEGSRSLVGYFDFKKCSNGRLMNCITRSSNLRIAFRGCRRGLVLTLLSVPLKSVPKGRSGSTSAL